MTERRQLPPQIRRVELARRAGSKAVVRYQLTVDTGTADGKREQLRRRYRTEKDARAALAEIQGQVNAGTYVQPSALTVEQACADWLQSRHRSDPRQPRVMSRSCNPCAANWATLPFRI
ncbi:MAG: integrase [Mycobacterium sp.]|jgi:integrase|nr:integrase [Mycobacterium sp.]